MRLRTIAHLCGEGVVSVWDNGLLSLAAVSTVGISLFVLALVALLALNMQHLARVVDAQVQIVAYLQPTNAASQESALTQQIGALPNVTRVTFISKAQALAQLKQQFGQDSSLFASVQKNNPLPDAVEVYVAKPAQVQSVVAAVSALTGVQSVRDAQSVVDKLSGFTQAVRVLGIFLVAALALATVVVIGNAVRVAVYARRDQIAIMKLVGATNGFIRWPFFVEGAVLGLCGAVVSGAVVWWGYGWVARAVGRSMAFLPLLPATHVVPTLGESLLGAGVLLGALGSAISVRRHLNV